MEQTRKHFSQDFLIGKVRDSIVSTIKSPVNISKGVTDTDCLMSALALFSFKFPTMLMFDEHCKMDEALRKNIKTLFYIETLLVFLCV